MQIRVTSAAHSDLIAAHDWYETRSVGLGKALLAEVDSVLAFIARHPTVLAPVHREVRRVLTNRFPYAVYYDIRGGHTVRVIAVLHTAMNPERLVHRVE